MSDATAPVPPSPQRPLRVAVIGAGPAGIYAAEALTRLGAALAGKVSGPPQVRTLTAVPGGDAEKGRL